MLEKGRQQQLFERLVQRQGKQQLGAVALESQAGCYTKGWRSPGMRGCGLVAGLGSAGLMTGLNDLRGLLQTESFYG